MHQTLQVDLISSTWRCYDVGIRDIRNLIVGISFHQNWNIVKYLIKKKNKKSQVHQPVACLGTPPNNQAPPGSQLLLRNGSPILLHPPSLWTVRCHKRSFQMVGPDAVGRPKVWNMEFWSFDHVPMLTNRISAWIPWLGESAHLKWNVGTDSMSWESKDWGVSPHYVNLWAFGRGLTSNSVCKMLGELSTQACPYRAPSRSKLIHQRNKTRSVLKL